MKNRVLKLALGTLLILGAGTLVAFLISKGLRLFCVFNLITGLNCPGCGNTRAMMALLRLDFKSMLYYNLLFPLEMLYVVSLYVRASVNYIKGKGFSFPAKVNPLDVIMLVLLTVWGIVRNCTPLF